MDLLVDIITLAAVVYLVNRGRNKPVLPAETKVEAVKKDLEREQRIISYINGNRECLSYRDAARRVK